MKDNRYTRALDSVHISESALENGLKYARETIHSDREGKVIYMKNSRNGYWKTAVAAAGLAVVIGAGGILWSLGSKDNAPKIVDHEFTITANAEEIRRDVALELGELRGAGGGIAFLEDKKALSIEQGIRFNIRIKGDDIESVTFSTEDSYSDDMYMKFMLRNDFAALVEHNGTDNRISENTSIPNCTGATEFTVPYENQLSDEQFDTYAALTDDVELDDARQDPLELYVILDEQPAEDFYNEHPDIKSLTPHEFNSIMSESFVRFFNDHSNIAKVAVTVNFTDGVSQTEVIRLSSGLNEYNEDWRRPVLYAELD